mmetsp:Transcript_1339/g.4335  ORF Transcript_1339/g.4335 Transcript_1339/m.4335 type:complete len:262 (-) Transcript_1339:518-1303(-)
MDAASVAGFGHLLLLLQEPEVLGGETPQRHLELPAEELAGLKLLPEALAVPGLLVEALPQILHPREQVAEPLRGGLLTRGQVCTAALAQVLLAAAVLQLPREVRLFALTNSQLALGLEACLSFLLHVLLDLTLQPERLGSRLLELLTPLLQLGNLGGAGLQLSAIGLALLARLLQGLLGGIELCPLLSGGLAQPYKVATKVLEGMGLFLEPLLPSRRLLPLQLELLLQAEEIKACLLKLRRKAVRLTKPLLELLIQHGAAL